MTPGRGRERRGAPQQKGDRFIARLWRRPLRYGAVLRCRREWGKAAPMEPGLMGVCPGAVRPGATTTTYRARGQRPGAGCDVF